jgi:uncharacterized membrane protein
LCCVCFCVVAWLLHLIRLFLLWGWHWFIMMGGVVGVLGGCGCALVFAFLWVCIVLSNYLLCVFVSCAGELVGWQQIHDYSYRHVSHAPEAIRTGQ